MERDFGEAGAQLRKRKSPSLTKDWFEKQVPHRSSPGIFSEQQLHNVRLSVGSEEVTPGFWSSSKVVRKKPYFAVRSSARLVAFFLCDTAQTPLYCRCSDRHFMGAVEAAREDAMWHLLFKLETQMYLYTLLAAHKDLRLLLVISRLCWFRESYHIRCFIKYF